MKLVPRDVRAGSVLEEIHVMPGSPSPRKDPWTPPGRSHRPRLLVWCCSPTLRSTNPPAPVPIARFRARSSRRICQRPVSLAWRCAAAGPGSIVVRQQRRRHLRIFRLQGSDHRLQEGGIIGKILGRVGHESDYQKSERIAIKR